MCAGQPGPGQWAAERLGIQPGDAVGTVARTGAESQRRRPEVPVSIDVAGRGTSLIRNFEERKRRQEQRRTRVDKIQITKAANFGEV